jgi:hypothetical protein
MQAQSGTESDGQVQACNCELCNPGFLQGSVAITREDWLRRRAAFEDQSLVSVGGLVEAISRN